MHSNLPQKAWVSRTLAGKLNALCYNDGSANNVVFSVTMLSVTPHHITIRSSPTHHIKSNHHQLHLTWESCRMAGNVNQKHNSPPTTRSSTYDTPCGTIQV
jgi:iron uptake system EfeUOB component EfeO/EfeM